MQRPMARPLQVAHHPHATSHPTTLSPRPRPRLIKCCCSGSLAPAQEQERLKFLVPNEECMAVLARRLASSLQAGDVYCLYGEVGAGKSVFSRAFIRGATGDEELPVPSPTFLLQNVYEGWEEEGDEEETPAIHHFDLYRLAGSPAGAMERLDLQGSFAHAVSLVEWAERLPAHALPASHLAVHIAIQPGSPMQPTSVQLAMQPSMQPASSMPHDACDDDESDSEFTDRRARLVTLTAHGTEWPKRLVQVQAFMQDLTQADRTHGLCLVEN